MYLYCNLGVTQCFLKIFFGFTTIPILCGAAKGVRCAHCLSQDYCVYCTSVYCKVQVES